MITITSDISAWPLPYESYVQQWSYSSVYKVIESGETVLRTAGTDAWSPGVLLGKGRATAFKHCAPPEKWKLLWANQRESPSLTNRFSSKILGRRAPRWGACRGSGEWVQSRQGTRSCRPTSQSPVPHKVTQPEDAGTCQDGDTRGKRTQKGTMLRFGNEGHTSKYLYLNLSTRHTHIR